MMAFFGIRVWFKQVSSKYQQPELKKTRRRFEGASSFTASFTGTQRVGPSGSHVSSVISSHRSIRSSAVSRRNTDRFTFGHSQPFFNSVSSLHRQTHLMFYQGASMLMYPRDFVQLVSSSQNRAPSKKAITCILSFLNKNQLCFINDHFRTHFSTLDLKKLRDRLTTYISENWLHCQPFFNDHFFPITFFSDFDKMRERSAIWGKDPKEIAVYAYDKPFPEIRQNLRHTNRSFIDYCIDCLTVVLDSNLRDEFDRFWDAFASEYHKQNPGSGSRYLNITAIINAIPMDSSIDSNPMIKTGLGMLIDMVDRYRFLLHAFKQNNRDALLFILSYPVSPVQKMNVLQNLDGIINKHTSSDGSVPDLNHLFDFHAQNSAIPLSQPRILFRGHHEDGMPLIMVPVDTLLDLADESERERFFNPAIRQSYPSVIPRLAMSPCTRRAFVQAPPSARSDTMSLLDASDIILAIGPRSDDNAATENVVSDSDSDHSHERVAATGSHLATNTPMPSGTSPMPPALSMADLNSPDGCGNSNSPMVSADNPLHLSHLASRRRSSASLLGTQTPHPNDVVPFSPNNQESMRQSRHPVLSPPRTPGEPPPFDRSSTIFPGPFSPLFGERQALPPNVVPSPAPLNNGSAESDSPSASSSDRRKSSAHTHSDDVLRPFPTPTHRGPGRTTQYTAEPPQPLVKTVAWETPPPSPTRNGLSGVHRQGFGESGNSCLTESLILLGVKESDALNVATFFEEHSIEVSISSDWEIVVRPSDSRQLEKSELYTTLMSPLLTRPSGRREIFVADLESDGEGSDASSTDPLENASSSPQDTQAQVENILRPLLNSYQLTCVSRPDGFFSLRLTEARFRTKLQERLPNLSRLNRDRINAINAILSTVACRTWFPQGVSGVMIVCLSDDTANREFSTSLQPFSDFVTLKASTGGDPSFWELCPASDSDPAFASSTTSLSDRTARRLTFSSNRRVHPQPLDVNVLTSPTSEDAIRALIHRTFKPGELLSPGTPPPNRVPVPPPVPQSPDDTRRQSVQFHRRTVHHLPHSPIFDARSGAQQPSPTSPPTGTRSQQKPRGVAALPPTVTPQKIMHTRHLSQPTSPSSFFSVTPNPKNGQVPPARGPGPTFQGNRYFSNSLSASASASHSQQPSRFVRFERLTSENATEFLQKIIIPQVAYNASVHVSSTTRTHISGRHASKPDHTIKPGTVDLTPRRPSPRPASTTRTPVKLRSVQATPAAASSTLAPESSSRPSHSPIRIRETVYFESEASLNPYLQKASRLLFDTLTSYESLTVYYCSNGEDLPELHIYNECNFTDISDISNICTKLGLELAGRNEGSNYYVLRRIDTRSLERAGERRAHPEPPPSDTVNMYTLFSRPHPIHPQLMGVFKDVTSAARQPLYKR